MTSEDHIVDFYGETIELEDIAVECSVEYETYPLEPYTYGGSRGTVTEIKYIKIINAKLGDFVADRATLVLMFGETAVDNAEQSIVERYVDE